MDVNCFHRYNARTFPSHRIPALNNIFISIVLISVGIAAFTGNMAAVSHGAFDGARSAVNIAISLIGYMALFLGLMKVPRFLLVEPMIKHITVKTIQKKK